MAIDKATKHALKAGKQQAARVLASRNTALKRRAAALRKGETARRGPRPIISPRLLAAAGGQKSRGALLAEGDSWFDYPWGDILSMLNDEHGYDIRTVAHSGDRIQDMAYKDGQLEKFTRLLEEMIRNGNVPKAIMISGGGNDIAGDQFAVLLNHASSPNPGLNATVVEEVIDNRIKHAYITMISAITEICKRRLGRKVPILVHGYAYAVPDGRGA